MGTGASPVAEVGWVLAAMSSITAIACSVALVASWDAVRAERIGGGALIAMRIGGAFLALSMVHHFADAADALWGHQPMISAVVGSALAAMTCLAAAALAQHAPMVRHLALAPELIRFAVTRATVAEAALDDLRMEMMGDMRDTAGDAEGRVKRIESRVVRDADASALIAKLIASLSTAAVIVGADGALVVVTGNEGFWRLSAVPRSRGVRLADVLGMESHEAEHLRALFEREGATLTVRAFDATGAPRRVELQTVYLPAERGGRMWLVCRPVVGP